MSQGTRNTKLQEEMAKYEDSLDKKLDLKFASLSEKLPSKADFNELKDLFNGLNEKILYQDRKIASLEKDNTDFVILKKEFFPLKNASLFWSRQTSCYMIKMPSYRAQLTI